MLLFGDPKHRLIARTGTASFDLVIASHTRSLDWCVRPAGAITVGWLLSVAARRVACLTAAVGSALHGRCRRVTAKGMAGQAWAADVRARPQGRKTSINGAQRGSASFVQSFVMAVETSAWLVRLRAQATS